MKSLLRVAISTPLVTAAVLGGATGIPSTYGAPSRTIVSVGVGAVGQHSFEFIGKIDQNGGDFTAYGYLTAVRGLQDSLLFTDATTHTEATARFTFSAPGKLLARSVLGTLFVLSTTGTLTIYASGAGGATFSNPGSFQHGSVVATFSAHLQSIVNVQAPNQGILTIMGETAQQTARPFTLGGGTYRMGRTGLQAQMNGVGQGTRLEPTAPRASFNFAGAAIVGGDSNG
jgi:hypothetical protein